MTITEIRTILESPYNRKVWKTFLQTQFTNNKLNAEDRSIPLVDKALSKQCLSLGNYEINEYTKIGIFEVELNEKVNITRNRVALRNLIKDLTKQVAGAMVVFVQGERWRFSYISKRKIKNKETNQIQDTETAPKRYTYLFGKNEKALTAAQRFDKLILKQKDNLYQFLSLDDFEEAFSVEKLSKEFFNNYKETYEEFVEFITGKRFVKKGNKYEEKITKEPDWQFATLFNKDDKQARDFCKRMLGRIVFLYFIQKKGWLSVAKGKKWSEGNPNYLYDLFNSSQSKEDFYHRELVPLFFKTLNNTESEKESNAHRFPYLNGGLFDDSHDRKYNKLQLPKEIFDHLFKTFNNYNFTVYEDAPDEHTVAVDPEMLGHIFENLLEDNKDKGAFYTPKEIVHYMCQESLKTYLLEQDDLHFAGNDLARSTIDKVIQQNELKNDEKQFAEKNAYKIIDALEKVKICDPAIGSGAFPMGLLLEIFNTQIYLQELKGFKKGVSDADIKKHIIEESIYGVDIDAGAVDIARLRFWLSLVVDEEIPQPLPNLDFKIVCANTLIPLGQIKNYNIGGLNDIIHEMQRVRHDYFNASMDQKSELEKKFKSLQKDLLKVKEWANTDEQSILLKLYEYNPFEDKSCSWFDSWWMFGINEGFDIVIGNPPYVQLQNNGGALAKLYEKAGYNTFARKGDIYSLFYEKGWQILKPKGVLCFITSNGWMRNDYGENTRGFFSDQTNPILLIDFAGQKIFDSATVEVNILMFTRDKNHQKTLACIVKENVLNELSVFVRQSASPVSFNFSDSWVILSPIEQKIKSKIESIGVPLKDWDVNIYRGVLTGYNEAFIIDGRKRDELISQDAKSAEIIRPILRGRDINRYSYRWAGLYVILAYYDSHKILEIKYPAIYNHLLPYKLQLEQRGQCRYTSSGKINKNADYPGQHHWLELDNNPTLEKLDDFSKQKIVWGEISDRTKFCIDLNGGFTTEATTFLMTGQSLLYLLGFLNSKMSEYLFSKIGTTTGMGTIRWKKYTIEKLRVPAISIEREQKYDFLVRSILDKQNGKSDYTDIVKELDDLIYQDYQLTEEEVNFIRSQ